MSVIEKFLESYAREYDYYEKVARFCRDQCESLLEASGIRSIVTYRAKRPDRLQDKLTKRNKEKNYTCAEDIYQDIPDLAGVRIALYFPKVREEVRTLINSNFVVEQTKEFPDPSKPTNYVDRRFSGYVATHYRVKLKGAESRYCQARIEIQVASVLMHAWSEVEHDLIYKPMSGDLSPEEYAHLDQLNGLVQAGEIGLESLQRAFNNRVNKKGQHFNNHYELAAHLYSALQPAIAQLGFDPGMGRVDVAYHFLQLAKLDSPEKLEPYLTDFEISNAKEAIADQLLFNVIQKNRNFESKLFQAWQETDRRNNYGTRGVSDFDFGPEHIEYFMMITSKARDILGQILKVQNASNRFSVDLAIKQAVESGFISIEEYSLLGAAFRIRDSVIRGSTIQFSDIDEMNRIGTGIHNILDRWSKEAEGVLKEQALIILRDLDKWQQGIPTHVKRQLRARPASVS